MTKKLAIVGFNPADYDLCKFSDADEFWTMNHAVFVTKDLPRIDRMFELHHRDWYLRKELAKRAVYAKWLRKKQPFPIYMQEDELTHKVPSGVRYPLEEICDTLLSGLVKIVDGKEVNLKYFTSTYAYMIALAIYEHVTLGYWDEVELYGIGMESNTEYGYQKPCGEFWNGLALGRGMKIIQSDKCSLHSAVLYGYDVVPYMDQVHLRKIQQMYKEKLVPIEEKMYKSKAELETDIENVPKMFQYLEDSGLYYNYTGAIEACERYMLQSDTYISRQFIEIKRVEWINGAEHWKTKVNGLKGKMATQQPINPDDWKAYLDARASMHMNTGATQLSNIIMHVIDFRPVDYDLRVMIHEQDAREEQVPA